MKRRYQEEEPKEAKMNEFNVFPLRKFLNQKSRLLCDPSVNILQDVEYSQCKKEFKEFEKYICGSEILFNDSKKSQKECGKIFKSNESVYICRDCATDSTCVFCKECFVKSEHMKHNYQMTFSNGGGFCDCGDVEAWKTFPRCTLHGANNECCENYVYLENIETDFGTLSDDIKQRFLSFTKELFENFKHFIMRPLVKDEEINEIELSRELAIVKASHFPKNEYALVLYNNEIHNFEQVISLFRRCLLCTDEKAMEYANIINRDGRCAALLDNNLDNLENSQRNIITISLLETGVSFLCRIHHRSVLAIQKLLLHILQWLFEFINEHRPLRLLLCKYLLHDIPTDDGHIFEKSPFIQDIFNSHSQTWKMARKITSNFIMSSVMKEIYFKRLFAIEFVKNYKMIIEHYSLDDHNVEDSLKSLSCQIFTVPSLAKYLLEDYNVLRNVIKLCYDVLLKHSKPLILDNIEHPDILYFNKKENMFHNKFDSFEMHLESLNDVEYLLNSLITSFLGFNGEEDISSTSLTLSSWTSESISNFMDYFNIFAEILSLLQDTNVMERMTDQHIEEDPPWRTGLLLMHDLVSVITLTSNLITSNEVCWDKSLVLFRQIYKKRVIDLESKKIVLFEFNNCTVNVVDNDWPNKYISVIKPLHRFMSSLLLRSTYVKQLSQTEVDCLIDEALQMIVFTSQQVGHMWVRNGSVPYVLSDQMKSLILAPEMFDRDLQLIQQMALYVNPEEFIVKCIHKFDLKDYFLSHTDILLEKQSILQRVEDFLQLLISTLFFRYRPGVGYEVTREMCFEDLILHILSVAPLTHSKIMKKLPQVLQKYPKSKLMEIINKVADQSKQSRMTIFNPKISLIKTKFNRFSPYYSIQDRNEAEMNVQNILKNEDKLSVLTCPEPIDLSEDFSGLYCYLSDHCFLKVIDRILQFMNEKINGEFWTDKMLDMVLFLINSCLMEDLKVLNRAQANRRALFLETALKESVEVNIVEHLEHLCEKTLSDQQLHCIRWTIKQCYDIKRKINRGDNNEQVEMEVEGIHVIQQDKLSKSEIAQKRREQLMNRMKNMQKVFIKDNVGLLIESAEDNQTHKPNHPGKVTDLTCILCQEKSDNNLERPIIAIAGAWRSTVLAQNSELRKNSTIKLDLNQIVNKTVLPNLEHPEETFITSCGHVMHYDCKTKYMNDMIKRKQAVARTHGILYPRIFNRCPLCKFIFNIDIPIIKEDFNADEDGKNMLLNEWITLFMNWAPENVLLKTEKVFGLDHWWGKLNFKLNKIIQKKENYSGATERELLTCLAFKVNMATKLQPTKLTKESYKELISVRDSISESGFKEILDLDYSVSFTMTVWDQILRKQNLSLVCDIPERHMLGLRYLIKAVQKSHEELSNKESLKNECQSFLVLLQQMLFDCTLCSLHKISSDYKAHIFILEVDFIYVMTTLLLMRNSFNGINDKYNFTQHSPSYNLNVVRLIYRYVSLQSLLSFQASEVDNVEDSFTQLQSNNLILWSEDNVNKLYKSRVDLSKQVSEVLLLPVMTKYTVAVLFSRSLLSFLRCATFLLNILGPVSSVPRFENCNTEFNYLMDLFGLTICTSDDNLLRTSLQSHIGMISSSKDSQLQTILGTKLPLCMPLSPPCLIDLPHDFIDVLNMCSDRGCSLRQKSDNLVTDITLCLICGETFCLNGYCCRYTDESSSLVLNGAQIHARQCHGGYSIFLNLSSCKIVVMFYQARWQILMDPIYFDNYGEYDIGLKKGNPLFLNIDAYKKLEKSWLEHSLGYMVTDSPLSEDLFV